MDFFLTRVFEGQEYKKHFLTKEGSERQYIRIQQKKMTWILACSLIPQQKKFLLRHKDLSLAGLNMLKIIAQDNKKGFILLEDLGTQDLETKVLNNKLFPFLDYSSALDQIIQLQNFSKNIETYKKWRTFTQKDFFKEILFTQKYLIDNLFNLKLEDSFKKAYLKEGASICEQLTLFPYKPAHRDFHSRNIFVKNKKSYLIDFQDAAEFPRFYDLVSLIYDVYVEKKLTNYYKQKLLNYFLRNSFFCSEKITPKIREEITLTALQRIFKACGSFASFYCLKKQDTHLKYIYPALQILESLAQEQSIKYPYFLKLIQKLLYNTPTQLRN